MILDRVSGDVGIAWAQGTIGKIWWTLITGTQATSCQEVANVASVQTVPDATQPDDGGVPAGGFSAARFLNQ